MTKVLGIDLGTSRSAAAVVVDGDVRIIPSSDSKTKTGKPFPSVVSFFEEGGGLIGSNALEQSTYNPKGTIFNAKRKMGSGEKFEVFGKEFLPQFISALILIKIKIDAENFLKEKVTKAVITVPAYFNDNQRQATKEAGEIAGLDVVRIMPEPIAAAVSYGLGKIKEPTKILVFDMGAGTLDVSIIEIDNGFFEVKATGGNTALGGVDMDKEIANYLLNECKKQTGLGIADDDTISLQMMQLAERIKIELSEKSESTINETFYLNGSQIKLDLKVSRSDFETMIKPILEKSEECIQDVLSSINLSANKIDKVILVGGPTKLPIIRSRVAKLLKEPETGVDPDFSVARGAAIEGAVLANDNDLPILYQGLTLLNATPLDLGEQAVTIGGHGKEMVIKLMIPRNTTYPTEVTQKFYKQYPISPKIEISVWQGDFKGGYDFASSVNLGKFWLYVPQREGLEIEVTYKIDADGILTVSATETSSGNRDELVIEKIGDSVIPPPQLEEVQQEAAEFEKEYRRTSHDVLNPYEKPVEENYSESGSYRWMCNCLQDAKMIINAYHKGYDCKEFLSKSQFELFIQLDKQYAFGYIGLGMHPYYPIGIHNALKEDTMQNRRMIIVVLVHELLHAIHPDWGHDWIRPEESKLANLAGLYDALRNLEVLFLSGKMSFCNNHGSMSQRNVRIKC